LPALLVHQRRGVNLNKVAIKPPKGVGEMPTKFRYEGKVPLAQKQKTTVSKLIIDTVQRILNLPLISIPT
jgi:hypothetical protein